MKKRISISARVLSHSSSVENAALSYCSFRDNVGVKQHAGAVSGGGRLLCFTPW